jgi:hypothetical protein
MMKRSNRYEWLIVCLYQTYDCIPIVLQASITTQPSTNTLGTQSNQPSLQKPYSIIQGIQNGI